MARALILTKLPNMQRSYLSGAQKRKIAEEKRAKKAAAIEKLPKIDSHFHVKPSTSASASAPTLSHTEDDENIEKESESSSNALVDIETGELAGIRDGIDLSAIDVPDNSDETNLLAADASDNHNSEFSTDAALWNIPADISSLQIYWITKGD